MASVHHDGDGIDVGFVRDSAWFRVRAGAIVLDRASGTVAMVGNATGPYVPTVGGGVHHGETAAEAAVREEPGVRLTVKRLVAVHENYLTESAHRRWRA